jgi:hypothetical protein
MVRRSFATEAKTKRNGSGIDRLFCLLRFKAKQKISDAKQQGNEAK